MHIKRGLLKCTLLSIKLFVKNKNKITFTLFNKSFEAMWVTAIPDIELHFATELDFMLNEQRCCNN